MSDRMMFARRSSGRLTALAAILVAGMLVTAPSVAGPPFRTDDPEPVEFQHFEITGFSFGTKTANGWSGFLPAMEVNYGVLPNLQLHAIIQQGFSGLSGGRTGFGLGDIELGAKYRLLTPGEDDWYPQMAIFPLVEVPVGNQNLGFSTGHTQFFLPLWLQKEIGPWTVYGGGGYWINPGVGNKNYAFFGAAVWRKLTDDFGGGLELFHQTPSVVDGDNATGFNVGGVYNFSDTWHVLSSVGTGVNNRSSTNQFSYYLGLQLTF